MRPSSRGQEKSKIVDYIFAIKEMAIDIERFGGPTETEKPEIKQLDDCFRKLLTQEKKLDEFDKIKHRLQEQISNASYEDVGKIFDNALSSMDISIKFPENEKYQVFRNEILHVYHPNDIYGGSTGEDILMDKRILNIHCPITKEIMKKPVQSNICHHVYDEPNILELIRKGRGSCRCPVAGCSHNVNRGCLEKDPYLEREIEHERKKQEERESQKIENALELD